MSLAVFRDHLIVGTLYGNITSYSWNGALTKMNKVPVQRMDNFAVVSMVVWRDHLISGHYNNVAFVWNANLVPLWKVPYGGNLTTWSDKLISNNYGMDEYHVWDTPNWKPIIHSRYPKHVRNSIRGILFSLPRGVLPRELWFTIVGMIVDSWSPFNVG